MCISDHVLSLLSVSLLRTGAWLFLSFEPSNSGNILILRGNIEILPVDRTTVSYEFLSQLVGEYILVNCHDIDIAAALSMMPSTTSA
jgi:MINDY deubiquitinase